MVGNQYFIVIGSSNEQEKCARQQENHRVSYSLVIEIKRITIARGCTHEAWIKSMVKDYVVSNEVPTPHFENLGGIRVWNQEVDALRYVSLRPFSRITHVVNFLLKKRRKWK